MTKAIFASVLVMSGLVFLSVTARADSFATVIVTGAASGPNVYVGLEGSGQYNETTETISGLVLVASGVENGISIGETYVYSPSAGTPTDFLDSPTPYYYWQFLLDGTSLTGNGAPDLTLLLDSADGFAPDGTTGYPFGSEDFTLSATVLPETVTPEPSTALLLLTGLFGLVALAGARGKGAVPFRGLLRRVA